MWRQGGSLALAAGREHHLGTRGGDGCCTFQVERGQPFWSEGALDHVVLTPQPWWKGPPPSGGRLLGIRSPGQVGAFGFLLEFGSFNWRRTERRSSGATTSGTAGRAFARMGKTSLATRQKVDFRVPSAGDSGCCTWIGLWPFWSEVALDRVALTPQPW